jgi:preprotein translocase SecF subunit
MAWSILLFFMNLNLSIDFTGGMQIRVANVLDESFARNATTYLAEQWIDQATISIKAEQSFTDIVIKTSTKEDSQVTQIAESIQSFLISNNYIADEEGIIQSSITGPSVGAYMQSAALRAVIIGIIFMVIYMLFSFAAIRKIVAPSILASVTIITMLFDILIPAGAFGLLMLINPTIQVDTVFIIAILTIMGYSINDTIIIFDRIRENAENVIAEKSKNILYAKIFEDSIWQTMRRSIGTSISTLMVVVAMYLFGTGVIKIFAFTTGVGVLAGTVSSIFIAAPLAYLLLGKFSTEQKKL